MTAGAAAGGTLPRAPAIAAPGASRRIRLLVELGLFFLAVPLAIRWAIHAFQVPVFVLMQPILAVLIVYLLIDRTFQLRRELTRGFSLSDLLSILAIFLIAGGMVTAFVAEVLPAKFLVMPRQRPESWQKVMLLYPVLSVLAQEFYYRTFFFHRYGPLFGGTLWAAILTNGALFAFSHILFGNWVAVAGTFLTGTLFAYRYASTRSYWAVCLEHTLWGWLVFTVGLGSYFFTGVSNFVLR